MELIQWPRAQYWDKAWNPIVGCRPCSPACYNCYARALTERFGHSFEPRYAKPGRPPRKGVVFAGNMTDLFGAWVDDPAIFIYATGKKHRAPKAKFLYLTKRVERMIRTIYDGAAGNSIAARVRDIRNSGVELYHHFFGWTAEDQDWFDIRLRDFQTWPTWAKWWISAEPLLGPIDLHFQFFNEGHLPSWVVVGCESGQHRRPCKIEWVESIVDQCRTAGVPVFVKQLDIDGACERDIEKFPAHLQIRQVPWAKKEGAE